MIWGYYKKHEKSLRLEEKRSNWPEARRRLDAWIQSIENPAAPEPVRPSLFAAIQMYDEAVMRDRPKGARYEFLQSVTMFYDGDMRLDFGTIQKHLAKRMQALKRGEIVSEKVLKGEETGRPFAPRTILQRVMRQREFFQWCFEQRLESATNETGPRWLSDPDPFEGVKLPEEPSATEAAIYTDAEHERIMCRFSAYARLWRRRRPGMKIHTPDWYPLLWRWQRLTAMRIEETTSLRWAEAVPAAEQKKRNHIGPSAAGGGAGRWEIALHDTKSKKPRYIPLTVIPGLTELVAELRAMPPLPNGKVFPWATPCAPQEQFRLFLADQGRAHRAALASPSAPLPEGIVIVKRVAITIHVYRATAKALWLEWSIPESWCDYYAGHGRKAAELHYDVRPSYERMTKDGTARGGPKNGAAPTAPIEPAAAGYLPDITGAGRVIQGDFRKSG